MYIILCSLFLSILLSVSARKSPHMLRNDCIAHAGDSECSTNATTTIMHTSQLSALANCTTFTGVIYISGVTLTSSTPTVTLTGNEDLVPSPILTLHGIQEIEGGLKRSMVLGVRTIPSMTTMLSPSRTSTQYQLLMSKRSHG